MSRSYDYWVSQQLEPTLTESGIRAYNFLTESAMAEMGTARNVPNWTPEQIRALERKWEVTEQQYEDMFREAGIDPQTGKKL